MTWVAGVVVAGALGLACGSHKDSSLVGTTAGNGGDDTADGGEPSDASSATPSSGDDSGGVGVFISADAAPSVVFDCQPGTYSGMFTTQVSSDAGGLFSLFSFAWTGSLSITLQGMVTNDGAGEIPLPTLTIAPGAKLEGADDNGGHFTADMTGSLDCPSRVLTVTITNGSYDYIGDAGGVQMTGTMSATYDGTGTPQLTMGSMNVGSPQLPSLGAVGSWTATLQ